MRDHTGRYIRTTPMKTQLPVAGIAEDDTTPWLDLSDRPGSTPPIPGPGEGYREEAPIVEDPTYESPEEIDRGFKRDEQVTSERTRT